jgi:hypothetical protein
MKTKYKFFWNGKFSNWHPSEFVIDGITFNCGEQMMMYKKAILFNDFETAEKILAEPHPRNQKKLGREVKNFNKLTWDDMCYDLVKDGLREKFNQNPDLKEYLLKYKGYTIVEASPEDAIWGIGFGEWEALDQIDNWGKNYLGKICTELANEL